jgi:hypothetical protein
LGIGFEETWKKTFPATKLSSGMGGEQLGEIGTFAPNLFAKTTPAHETSYRFHGHHVSGSRLVPLSYHSSNLFVHIFPEKRCNKHSESILVLCFFRRLDGAMQMLEALEDMLEQQRKAISAQKVAISALKDPDFPVSQFPQWKIY